MAVVSVGDAYREKAASSVTVFGQLRHITTTIERLHHDDFGFSAFLFFSSFCPIHAYLSSHGSVLFTRWSGLVVATPGAGFRLVCLLPFYYPYMYLVTLRGGEQEWDSYWGFLPRLSGLRGGFPQVQLTSETWSRDGQWQNRAATTSHAESCHCPPHGVLLVVHVYHAFVPGCTYLQFITPLLVFWCKVCA